MVRYRTESFSGLGERDAAEVMAYETFTMGNVDILETLEKGLLKNNPELRNRCLDFIEELNNNGYVEDFSCSDGVAFYKEVLEEIQKVTGHDIQYALWLADKNVVTGKECGCYGKDMYDAEDYDAYEVGPVVLSDLGSDGSLYGYVNYPEPIEKSKEMRECGEVMQVLSEEEDLFERYDDILFERIAEVEYGYSKNLMALIEKYSFEPEKIQVLNEVLEAFTGTDIKGLLFAMGQEKKEQLRDVLKDVIDASECDDLTWAEAEELDNQYSEITYKMSLMDSLKQEKLERTIDLDSKIHSVIKENESFERNKKELSKGVER